MTQKAYEAYHGGIWRGAAYVIIEQRESDPTWIWESPGDEWPRLDEDIDRSSFRSIMTCNTKYTTWKSHITQTKHVCASSDLGEKLTDETQAMRSSKALWRQAEVRNISTWQICKK
jgi:hypothetical protein